MVESLSVHALLKKVHLYFGLLSFCALVVYGIAGLQASFFHRGPPPVGEVRFEPYTPPPQLGDREVADDIQRALQITLAGPVHANAVKRDARNDLTFTLYSPNGPTRVTLLEKENRLRIEPMRNGLGQFLNNLHATTINASASDVRVTLWKIYNEVSMWSLIGMVLSGAWLGLTARPRFPWAKVALAVGSCAFVVLYVATR